MEAISGSESEAAPEISSEFDELEEASEDEPFLWTVPRSMTTSQLDIDAESNDVQPNEESHLHSDTLETVSNASVEI